jgi:hypothetical protein
MPTRLKITATVCDALRLNRWLQGFGSDVTDVRKQACPPALAPRCTAG